MFFEKEGFQILHIFLGALSKKNQERGKLAENRISSCPLPPTHPQLSLLPYLDVIPQPHQDTSLLHQDTSLLLCRLDTIPSPHPDHIPSPHPDPNSLMSHQALGLFLLDVLGSLAQNGTT